MALTRFPLETTEPKIEVTLPVGRHVLELVVEDSAGLRSAPDTVVIEVKKVIITSPTITIPTFTKPTVTFPTMTLPTVTLPTITKPTATIPTATLPTMTMPTFTMPTVTIPTITMPTATMPTMTLPTLTMTMVTMPTMTVHLPTEPTMTVPHLETNIMPFETIVAAPTNIGPSVIAGPSVITRGRNVTKKATLKTIKGVTDASAKKLTAAGITDAETLAKAPADQVAAALGIDKAKASAIIKEAEKAVKK